MSREVHVRFCESVGVRLPHATHPAKVVREWLQRMGVRTLFIEPGSPWENGYVESFNGKLRDELLNGEIFYTIKEAKILIERWRHYYNTKRPHSALGYRPPAPEAVIARPAAGYAALRRSSAPPAAGRGNDFGLT